MASQNTMDLPFDGRKVDLIGVPFDAGAKAPNSTPTMKITIYGWSTRYSAN